ncbi:wax ester/triacylglycerol synthase family O-acyltransferase [Novosphingobium aquae]|uniref:diacylglycerol O-acyltransferase n=1 Tax=Novosphingobium aquae TaxID=3133435 RepID=A0ABU8S612_9SPHN
MVQQLNAQDAQFLYFQTGDLHTHIMGIYIYDPATASGGQVRFKDIVRQVRDRMHSSPVFRRKLYRLPLDFDHPYWVEDDHFDLEAHISHVRLPEPGDWRQFCIHVARHFSRPMDMNRPLWDIYVIEGLDRIPGIAPGSYALLHRVHHSAIDGTAGALMFAALNDCDAAGTPAIELPKEPVAAGKQPALDVVLTRAAIANMRSPFNLTRTAMAFMPNLWGAFQDRLAKRDEQPAAGVPVTRFNAPVSPHKMFDAATFALSDVSALRRLVQGTTINDVVLAICGGALRRYLDSHGELPDDSLIAIAPINARPSGAKAEAQGNNISAMTLKLSTTIADPVERLRAIRAHTADAKEARAGLSARIMTDLSRHIPGATLAGIARMMSNRHLSFRQANLLISNVPGPQTQLYMNGARLTHYYAMGPLANNLGLFLSVVSYNGQINFSITSEREMLPDISHLKDQIVEEFKALKSRVEAVA